MNEAVAIRVFADVVADALAQDITAFPHDPTMRACPETGADPV
jgi:hypothetical protein